MTEKNILRRGIVRIILALLIIGFSSFFLWRNMKQIQEERSKYVAEVIPPTCTDSGYTLYRHPESGKTILDDIVPATGHSLGEWQEVTQATLLQAGVSRRICESCGQTEERFLYLSQPIAVLGLEGDLNGIGKAEEVGMMAAFEGMDTTFESYATLKYQGHSSLGFDKKNYTLKLWEDSLPLEKNKLSLSHWNKENKYILKADYLDPTMSRNLICANVWASVVASREDLPSVFESLSNYGAVDGFPTVLYINGTFEGLYNMNLHKDEDLFGMKEDAHHAIMITNDPTGQEAFFKEPAAFTENSPWEIEFCGTEDETWVKEKLNDLINFVINSDDDTFRIALEEYLDIDSAIDYLLSIYVLGLTGHGADELVLVCYDKEDPWIASMYDMETGFGLSSEGKTFLSADQFLPKLQGESWDSQTDNLLWDRLLQNFYPRICRRYEELRKSVFATEHLNALVADFTDSIPAELYQANDAFHEGYPAAAEGVVQIYSYINERIQQTDKVFCK